MKRHEFSLTQKDQTKSKNRGRELQESNMPSPEFCESFFPTVPTSTEVSLIYF